MPRMQCREERRCGSSTLHQSMPDSVREWPCSSSSNSTPDESTARSSWSTTTLTWSRCCCCCVSLLVMCSLLASPAMAATYAPEARTMGINYGRLADNIPTGAQTVQNIKSLGISRVRIFDFDAATIQAFAGSDLELVIGMGNLDIPALATASAADAWIAANVVPYYPATNITCITVGNELFTYPDEAYVWPSLVPAIQNLYDSLQSRGLTRVKVSTAVEYSVLGSSFPPSSGAFRDEISTSTMKPLLAQLDATGSYLFVNVYPYFGWSSNTADIPLDYALFTRDTVFTVDPVWNLQYSNLLDAQLDAMAAAMEAVGYGDVRIVVSETGWPSLGDANTLGANVSNAQTYNNNLVKWALSNPTTGTPRRHGVFVPTYIFAVYNEDLKPGATTERNWGVLYPTGSAVYPLDITGSGGSGSGGGSSSGGGGGSPAQPKSCNGRPSVLSLSASFFGVLFNLRI